MVSSFAASAHQSNKRWRTNLTKMSLLKCSIWIALFTSIIPYPLPWALGQATLMSSDVASFLLYIYIFGSLLRTNFSYKASRTAISFFTLLCCWLLWTSFAYVILPDREGLALVARIFKKAWIFLPYAILGYQIGRGSFEIKKYCITTLLVFTVITSSIAVGQCISGGRLLSGHYTNQRFLGFLTPLPEARYAYRNLGSLTLEQSKALRTMGVESEFVTSFLFRAHGPFEESNLLTSSTVPIVCLALGMLIKRNHLYTKRRLTIYFLITLLGVVVSFGIAGYGALVLVGFYLFMLNPLSFTKWLARPFIATLAFITITVTGIVIMPAFFNAQQVIDSRLQRIVNPLESDAFNGRIRIINAAIEDIQAAPWFGARSLDASTSTERLEAMTIYVNVAQTSGIPAQVLFLLIFIRFLQTSWQVYRKGYSVEERSLGLGIHLFFISLMLLGVVYNWIVFEGIAYIAVMLGAVCVAMTTEMKKFRFITSN